MKDCKMAASKTRVNPTSREKGNWLRFVILPVNSYNRLNLNRYEIKSSHVNILEPGVWLL